VSYSSLIGAITGVTKMQRCDKVLFTTLGFLRDAQRAEMDLAIRAHPAGRAAYPKNCKNRKYPKNRKTLNPFTLKPKILKTPTPLETLTLQQNLKTFKP
jgi:hypothetical protein